MRPGLHRALAPEVRGSGEGIAVIGRDESTWLQGTGLPLELTPVACDLSSDAFHTISFRPIARAFENTSLWESPEMKEAVKPSGPTALS